MRVVSRSVPVLNCGHALLGAHDELLPLRRPLSDSWLAQTVTTRLWSRRRRRPAGRLRRLPRGRWKPGPAAGFTPSGAAAECARPDDASPLGELYTRSGFAPFGSLSRPKDRYPLKRFPWKEARTALERLGSVTNLGEPVQLACVNPETGVEGMPVLGFSALMLRPGETVVMRRRSSSAVLHVVEGEAEALIDGVGLDVAESDTIAVPTHAKVRFANRSSLFPTSGIRHDAIALSLDPSDRSLSSGSRLIDGRPTAHCVRWPIGLRSRLRNCERLTNRERPSGRPERSCASPCPACAGAQTADPWRPGRYRRSAVRSR